MLDQMLFDDYHIYIKSEGIPLITIVSDDKSIKKRVILLVIAKGYTEEAITLILPQCVGLFDLGEKIAGFVAYEVGSSVLLSVVYSQCLLLLSRLWRKNTAVPHLARLRGI